MNPGGVGSDIWRSYAGWQQKLFSAIMISPKTAASILVALNVDTKASLQAGYPSRNSRQVVSFPGLIIFEVVSLLNVAWILA